jgi:hypothetical protein
MRIETVERELFTIQELSESSKETALQTMAQWVTEDSFWSECVIDDAKEIGALMGIEIDNIYFSGFWSQGDGACFTGQYYYKKGGNKAVKAHAPKDTELHEIAETLQELNRKYFYQLSATVRHQGYYSHEFCTDISTDAGDRWPTDNDNEVLVGTLRDFMRWIYKRLEAEYEYCTSEEVLIENAEVNAYEFDADGNIA